MAGERIGDLDRVYSTFPPAALGRGPPHHLGPLHQPNLERRHHLLKSAQDADPLWLRDPARIEAIFCCQFLALLLGALIEREIRTAMRQADTSHIPLYPELRACPAQSAERILAVLADITRHELHHDGRLVQTFEAGR